MSELFAFRTASPLPASFAAEFSPTYNPVSQTSTWENGTSLLGYTCTHASWGHCFLPPCGSSCNAYGSYCNLWGAGSSYRCDS